MEPILSQMEHLSKKGRKFAKYTRNLFRRNKKAPDFVRGFLVVELNQAI
jgi:hypothetical protein